MRPRWAVAPALAGALGIAASVLSVDHPETALSIAAGAFVLLVAELAGLRILSLLTRERATQNVVSPSRTAGRKVTLLVTASVDAPRRGPLTVVPWPVRLVAAGLPLVILACVARVQDVDDDWLGVAQLVPTTLLIVAVGALLDHAFAPFDERPGAATGPAAALALVRALDARPPRRLAVELVLCGAGADGMAAHVRRLRRAGVQPQEVCVLHLGDCGQGPPRFWRREGRVLPLAYHPQLLGLASKLAEEERALDAGAAASATDSPARAARARRWPAIRLGTKAQGGEAGPEAIAATVELALALVARLDADLSAAEPPPARTPRPARMRRLLTRS